MIISMILSHTVKDTKATESVVYGMLQNVKLPRLNHSETNLILHV